MCNVKKWLPEMKHSKYVTLVLLSYMLLTLNAKEFEDPRKMFYRYAEFRLKMNDRNTNIISDDGMILIEDKTFSFEFEAFDKNFRVELYRNEYLVSENYFVQYQENEKDVIYHPEAEGHVKHCHYTGYLNGVENSWVAVSMCYGISGTIHDGKEMFYVEPDFSSKGHNHFVFRASDIKSSEFRCGVNSYENFGSSEEDFLELHERGDTPYHIYSRNGQEPLVLELVIVNDNELFENYGKDHKQISEKNKHVTNIVNGIYSSLNISVALVGTVIWSEMDEITLSRNSELTLVNFLSYRRKRLTEHPHDSAALFTNTDFFGGVVGKAHPGTMCTYENSGIIIQDRRSLTVLTATTVAHELGHLFGMDHDTRECTCPERSCVMASYSSYATKWSSCSLKALEKAYQKGIEYCLKNKPPSIVGPVCGNGFLEEGEECDCGPKQFCSNSCCNVSSCKLYANATCATGSCCDFKTCQPKSKETNCRQAVSECDFPEFCDGISEFCPDDVFHPNGEKCQNEEGNCFDGKCQSHANQCKLLWGETANKSDSSCYSILNTKGNNRGHCGYNRSSNTYKSCNKEDALCGQLFCTHDDGAHLRIGMMNAAMSMKTTFLNSKGLTECYSTTIDFGLHVIDPGLSPNGAKCGEDKICVSQNCVDISSLNTDVQKS